MKAYQILIPVEGCHTLPFDKLEQAENYTHQKGIKDYILQEVEISPGERFRNCNTIYEKDTVFRGIVKGVIYSDHPEHMK